jgi:TonB-linked SusC/RagA family outer membrane protein
MKHACTIYLLSLLFLKGMTQVRTITGKIVDEKQNPVAGASIQAKNTQIAALSGSDGSFSIQLPPGTDTIIVSYVGYFTQELRAANPSTITLQLKDGSLSEVQIIAYGSVARTDLTGSAATIKANELEDKPFSSVDKTLQGSVAGLYSASSSGAPGSLAGVILRGYGSLANSGFALWVIDGAIATIGDNSQQSTSSNALSSLNPADIESVTVLKDAATTAIYGSRAANGVILITTKKGKAGNTRVQLSAEAGANDIAYKPSNKPVTSLQSQTLFREAVINAGDATDNTGADAFIANAIGFSGDYTKTNTDWLNTVSRTGSQSQYNLSMSGGDSKTKFYASGGWYDQDGTTIATGFKRYSGAFNLQHQANDKFKLSVALSGSAVKQFIPANGTAAENPVFAQHFLLPWYTPYNQDGSLRVNDSQGEFLSPGLISNPLAIAQENKSEFKQNTIRGNVSAEYKLFDNLTFTAQYSAEYFDLIEDLYKNPNYGTAYPKGFGLSTDQHIFDWTFTNIADYHHAIGKDNYFDAKLGYEAYDQSVDLLQALGFGFPPNTSLQYLGSAASAIPDNNSGINSNSTNSIFTTADFNILDRYILSGSLRRDGSSRFGEDHKWGNFFSVGGAWNLSKEAFLKDDPFVYALKLRASYGQTGNQQIGDYTALTTFGYGFSYGGNPGSALTNVGNPNLTWEKCSMLDIGLDFSFFKNNLGGTIDYYSRDNSNLIEAVPLSLTTGVNSLATGNNTQNRNVGALYNRGVEITLNGQPVHTKQFTWNIGVNMAHNTSRVTKLYRGDPITINNFELAVGHTLEYFMPIWAGVNPKDGTPAWYTDASKTQVTGDYNSAKYSFTGRTDINPKYIGSLTNTFTYKRLSLQVQFYFLFGNDVQDQAGSLAYSEGSQFGIFNQLSRELTAWQKPGDKTDVPQLIWGTGNHSSNALSTRFLYSGDYARLRNVLLEYAFLGSLIKGVHLNSLSVYVRATNLLTFVKDKHLPFDPEEGSTFANYDVYQPKTIVGGIRIGF